MTIRPSILRRTAGAIVAASLLAAVTIPAASAATTVHGRNAPSYSFGSAAWVASAQGQTIDNVALQGRAAVQETAGIKRARIYRVTTQANINGAWVNVQNNETDAVSDAPRAYAVSQTNPSRFCAANPGLTRPYRVRNTFAVRKDNGEVVTKTLYSHTFTARALNSDGACQAAPPPPPPPPPPPSPDADLEVSVEGMGTMLHGQVNDLDVIVENNGPGTAGNATAIVDFSPGLIVADADDRASLRTSSADPNDYVVNLGVFNAGEQENLDFDVNPDVVGPRFVKAILDGSVESSDHDEDTLSINVVPAADLSLYKSVNVSSIVSGDLVTYTFKVKNSGPDTATSVTLTDNWPAALSPPDVWTPGAVVNFNTAADTLTVEFGDVASGGTETINVTAPASSDSPTTVVNTASVIGNEADRDSADRTDSATFNIS